MYLINRQRLLERFLRYVRIGTAADPNSQAYPSSNGQLVLGKLLVKELIAIGIVDAHQDSNGLVWGTVPSNVDKSVPALLLNAHLDTSPEAPGDGCNPCVVEQFDGTEIVLGTGVRMDEANTPELRSLRGHTLITTDGTTLLGGDDKAGVASIMELAAFLMENPQIEHGPIRILFTCDEEIGRGTKHFDLAKADARFGYALDGGGAGTIDVETFSADSATVRFVGRNTHPSVGKGRMLNSIRAASRFVSMLPTDTLTPETTELREGFIHPHTLVCSVSESVVSFILRDFETARLADQAALLRELVDKTLVEHPGIEASIEIAKQYRNMADELRRFPDAVEVAEQAFERLGRSSKRDSIRGGTDGALMTELGLPCPNLSVGQYNIHSVREFASLDQMVEAIEHVVAVVEFWQSRATA